MFTRESSVQSSTNFMCELTVFVHKLKQEGIEIALLVSHWLIFLTNQQTKVLAPNYNPTERVVSHRSVLVI